MPLTPTSSYRAQPYRLTGVSSLNGEHIEQIDKMFEMLFTDNGLTTQSKFIVQVADPLLPNAQATGALATGYVKNTTTTGVLSTQAVPIPATDGGTGQTSYTIGDLLYASTSTVLSKLAAAAAGKVLRAAGAATAPAYSTFTIPDTFAQGDVIYASAANTLTALAKSTSATRYLSNTGASNNPAWAQIDLSNGVTGTLPVANGGTNAGTFTAGSAVFAGASGTYTQDNANYFWDNTNKRLGLGTAAPSFMFDVRANSATRSQAHFTASDDTNEGGYLTSTSGVQFFFSGGASFEGSAWTARGGTTAAIIGMDTGLLRFYTDSGLTNGNTFTPTKRIEIDTAGLVNLLYGQLQFPASQNASADANTLDDYEEGSWTPGLTFGGGSTGITYDTVGGRYVKVGKLVVVSGRIFLTSKGSSTGTAKVTSLPFTIGSGSTFGSGATNSKHLNMSGIGSWIGCLAGDGTTTMELWNGNAASTTVLTDTNFTNTSDFNFQLVYIASA